MHISPSEMKTYSMITMVLKGCYRGRSLSSLQTEIASTFVLLVSLRAVHLQDAVYIIERGGWYLQSKQKQVARTLPSSLGLFRLCAHLSLRLSCLQADALQL